MQSHQQRVFAERADLNNKIERLEAFIGTVTYHTASHDEQFLLRMQLLTMREYADVLGRRIALFGAVSG